MISNPHAPPPATMDNNAPDDGNNEEVFLPYSVTSEIMLIQFVAETKS